MRYLELTVRCDRAAGDLVAGALGELVGGVAVDDPLDVNQAIAQQRWDATDLAPGDPAWVTVRAYLPEAAGLEERRQQVDAELDRLRALGVGVIGPARPGWVRADDWANAWKQYFKPLRVGRRWLIIPSWEQAAPAPGELPLYLDPGMAFGTGQHATTALCLAWLEELVIPGAGVLDVGTGSGILAMAAARLGAAPVLGCDIDPVAVQVAGENAARNGVVVTVVAGGPGACGVQAWAAAARPALVVGNLTAAVVMQVVADIRWAMAPGARFLASGIIAEKRDLVAGALAAQELELLEVREQDGWVAMLSRRP